MTPHFFPLQAKPRRQKKRLKETSKEIIDNAADVTSGEENTNPTVVTPAAKKVVKTKSEGEEEKEEKKKEKKPKKEKKEVDGKEKKEKEPKPKKKKLQGPMHFTANNKPRAVDVLGDLDPSVFDEVSILFEW